MEQKYSLLLADAIKNMRDFDDKEGIVSFYYANYNSIDAHGRRMSKTAFNRTVKNNFNRIRHLQNHNPDVIVGKPIEFGSDENGAYVISKLAKNTAGRDLLALYNDEIVNEHSFLAEIIKSHKEGDVEVVDEARLWEVSSVTWGANQYTPTIALNAYDAMLRRGDLDESILNKLEEILNLLTPAEEHSDPDERVDYSEIINYINRK